MTTPANLLTQLHAVIPKVKGAVAHHKGTPGTEASARMERVYACKTVGALDLDVAATSLALYRLIDAGLETLVKMWVLAKGHAFALEAIALGVERGIVVDYEHWPSALIDGVVPFDSQPEDRRALLRSTALKESAKAIYALRTVSCAADNAQYSELKAAGERLASSGAIGSAIAVATVLSEEAALVNAVAVRAIAEKAPPEPEMLLASLRDVELGKRLMAAHILYLSDDSESAWTLVARLGGVAGAIFAAGGDGDHLVPYLEACESPDAFRALLQFTAHKKLGKQVQKVLLDHPKVTLEALAPVLADPKHKQLTAARVVATAIAKAHPELGAIQHSASTPVAKDLPPLLVSPPWLATQQAHGKAEPITLTPTAVPLASKKREGDLDALKHYAEWGDQVGDYADKKKRNREGWIKAIAEDHKYDRAVDLDAMLIGPEDLILEEWNAISDKRLLYYPNRYYGGAMLVALERRGPKFIPTLLRLVRLRPSGASRMPIDEIGVVLLTFDGSEVADVLVTHYESGKAFKLFADAWTRRYPDTAAKAAIPAALAGEKRAAGAIALLRGMVRNGSSEAIHRVAKDYERTSKEPVTAALDAVVGIDPLLFFPAKLPKLPDLFEPDALPPIVLKTGGALPAEAVRHVGTMLAMSTPESPYAGIAVVKDACTAESLRDFAWALFDAWLATGSSPKEAWVLHTLGFFGDDETARRLTPMIRAWPGERLAARAVLALGVLSAIGTDIALMLLDGIAEKVRFASIQRAARARIDEIAKARGLSRDELADRLVPGLGLDARGERTLDFGSRTFHVRFDELLVPRVWEGDKLLKDLPKPGKSDDKAKAKEAVATFKALKKDVATVARSRIDRFESAMIARRRWKADELRSFLIDKPIVLQLTRRLVWGDYEGEKRLGTFRVDADGTLLDAKDKPFDLDATHTVGIVHPIDVPAAEIAEWGRIFAEYEVLQPFAQLSREVLAPTSADRKAKALESQTGLSMPAPQLVFGLEKRRWKRWGASDGGSFSGHSKGFAGTPFTAHIQYSGAVGMGYIEPKETLVVEAVTFTKEGSKEEALRIDEVDPIIISEVLGDVGSLQGEV